MAFKEDLEQICGKVDGSFAASVMGFDGIPIETHEVRPPDGVELQSLLVEYSGIVSQVRQAAERKTPVPAPGYRPETMDVLFGRDAR